MPDTHSNRQTLATSLLAVGFVCLCAWPYATRLTHPTLYADDLVRLAIVRNVPLKDALTLPFNEHIAPLFELISRFAWTASGHRLSLAPLTFTLASALPWPLVLVLLARLVKRHTGSTASALGTVSLASLSWLHVEVVEWYSASSFAWALAGILLAFESPKSVALIASALAPAFSAVGLIAGPIGALGAFLRARDTPCNILGSALAPLVGTTLFLLFAWSFGFGSALSHSPARHLDLPIAIRSILTAPSAVLLPALVGLPASNAGTWEIPVTLVFFIACVVWAINDKLSRPLILGGLALILGGYAMTYAARSSGPGVSALLRVQRYHLLPQFGLSMLLAPLLTALLSRFETRPSRSWAFGLLIALLMVGLHGREMRLRALCYRFPAQAPMLLSLERLEPLWKRAGLSRDQVIAVLGTDQKRRWCDLDGLNPWIVLGPLAESSPVPNDRAPRLVLDALSDSDHSWLTPDLSPLVGSRPPLRDREQSRHR